VRELIIVLVVGALASLGSMSIEWNYCLAGDARGLPFAITHPGHGPHALQIDLDRQGGHGLVLDIGSVLGDLALFSLVLGLPTAAVAGRVIRRYQGMDAP